MAFDGILAAAMTALTPPSSPGLLPPSPRTWLQRVVLLEPGEAPAFLWAAAYFFFFLFSYYLIKAVRDAIGIRGDLDTLPWLWTTTTIATFVASPIFALVVSRFPRRVFVPWLYRTIGIISLLFWIAMTAAGEKNLLVGYAFFAWVSVYNLLSTSVFWGFMADYFTQAQGKRLFGAIGVGGTVGAILGSWIPAVWAAHIGPVNLILLSVALLEVVAQCVLGMCRQAGFAATSTAHQVAPHSSSMNREPSRSMWAGFVLIARSTYLQVMVAYMLLFTITSTFLEFEQARVIKSLLHTDGERTQMYSRVNLGYNVLTLITQLFLTGRILTLARGRGIFIGLLILPVITILGFAAFDRWEVMTVLLLVQIVRKAMHYAVDRPTREVLYTVLSPDAKYKSKSFIDTFVYRAGDVIGIWTSNFLKHASIAISGVGLAIAGAWFFTGFTLAIMQRRVAKSEEASQDPPGSADNRSALQSPAASVSR